MACEPTPTRLLARLGRIVSSTRTTVATSLWKSTSHYATASVVRSEAAVASSPVHSHSTAATHGIQMAGQTKSGRRCKSSKPNASSLTQSRDCPSLQRRQLSPTSSSVTSLAAVVKLVSATSQRSQRPTSAPTMTRRRTMIANHSSPRHPRAPRWRTYAAQSLKRGSRRSTPAPSRNATASLEHGSRSSTA